MTELLFGTDPVLWGYWLAGTIVLLGIYWALHWISGSRWQDSHVIAAPGLTSDRTKVGR